MTPPTEDGLDPRVARTRECVLSATSDLLIEHGFERITIDGIAERCGMARSTIYRNWPCRGRLLVDAFEALSPPRSPPDNGSLAEDLRALGTTLAAMLHGSPAGRVLPSLVAAAHHDPELRGALAQFTSDRRRSLRVVFERARDRGELRNGVDLDAAVIRFAAPFFYRRLLTDDPLDAEVVEAEVAATLAVVGADSAPLRRG